MYLEDNWYKLTEKCLLNPHGSNLSYFYILEDGMTKA